MKSIIQTSATTAIILTALTSCGAGGTRELPLLDVTASYPEKNLILQDVATVEYIPLETGEGFLVDYLNIGYMDDEFVVTGNQAGNIMFFDRRTGRGVKSFNRKGRGPGEYSGIYNIAVDREGGELFVTPNSISSYPYPIYVYDLDGKPLRTLGVEGVQFPSFFHNYDADHLFFYNSRNPEPLGLISKRDTTVTYLPARLEGEGDMSVSGEIEGGIRVMYRGDPISRTRDGLMLSKPGVDTMFRWSSATNELTPVIASHPAFNSMEFPIGVFFSAESNDYIFLQTIERRWDWERNEGFDTKNLILDKREGKFYEGGIVNSDFADERLFTPVSRAGVPAGVYVTELQPYQLLDLHEKGKLRGRLAEIAPTLTEDDNPVMMIVTFK